jgi:hypothetical protein
MSSPDRLIEDLLEVEAQLTVSSWIDTLNLPDSQIDG